MTDYPLTFPAQIPASATITPVDIVGISTNPFTGSRQAQKWGQFWRASIQMPPLTRAQAQVLRGWRLALGGPYGTFLWSPPGEGTPLGPAEGTPVVDGAGQTGDSLITRGWTNPDDTITADSTAVTADSTLYTMDAAGETLKAGDWLQIGTTGLTPRLHQVTTTAFVEDAETGQSTLSLWPDVSLAQALTDGQTIVTADPEGLFQLANRDDGWDVQPGPFYALAFDIVSVP